MGEFLMDIGLKKKEFWNKTPNLQATKEITDGSTSNEKSIQTFQYRSMYQKINSLKNAYRIGANITQMHLIN